MAEETTPEGDVQKTEEVHSQIQIDYEAELNAEKARREEAERKLQETRDKARERWERRKAENPDLAEEENDIDKPITGRQLQDLLESERQKTVKEFRQEEIAKQARSLAGSDTEANLIVEIHKNRTFPANMSIGEQIEEAYAIANRKRLMAQNEELKRGLRSKETVSTDDLGTYRKPLETPEPKFSDADTLREEGFVWDSKSKSMIKPINKDKTRFFHYDPRTKRRWADR
jgi:hypothetical protein